MRLYDDSQGAFLVSIRPQIDEDRKYEILNDGKHGWYVHFTLIHPFLSFLVPVMSDLVPRIDLKSFWYPDQTVPNT